MNGAACLLGQAIGDAVGVPYEYGCRPTEVNPQMHGGGLGPYEPGEWSDDTQMAACIALAASRHRDLGDRFIEDVAVRFRAWANTGATDIGGSTAGVLRHALVRQARKGEVAAACTTIAQHNWETFGSGLGNGALMRTAALAAVLPDGMPCRDAAALARTIAALTHAAPLSQEITACWTVMLQAAIMGEGMHDAKRYGLAHTAPWARTEIEDALALAENTDPWDVVNTGHVSRAMQAAWSAVNINETVEPRRRLQAVLSDAIWGGGDTDTVAAIAGGMVGALGGMEVIPRRWLNRVFGWPGITGRELASLAAVA